MRGLILVITALILSAIILPIGFVVGIIAALDKYLFKIAKSIDQLETLFAQNYLIGCW